MELLTKRRKPVDNLWNYAYLITGEKKIGKTSFAIEGAEEYVLQFDKPNLAYEIRELTCKNWLDFKNTIDKLIEKALENDFPYTRIVVDGVEECYDFCTEYCCKKLGVADPADAEWGKGWRAIKKEFNKYINKLLSLQSLAKCGIIFIAHSEWKETPKKGSKQKIEVLTPSLPEACRKIIVGKVDAWFSYEYYDNHRILILQGSEEISAGHRIDRHFLTLEGEPIESIYMGKSAKEALKAFTDAFNNKIIHTQAIDALSVATNKPKIKGK